MRLNLSIGSISLGMVCLLALSGCVTDLESTTQEPRVASAAVKLDDKEPDRVTANDVINRSKRHVKRTGEIYMMRGIANVFSRGIDEMAVNLRQGGYDAVNFSYAQWSPIAQDIVRRAGQNGVSYPVIIVGHSLGANESSKFANYLGSNKVEVELVVAFDPVETGKVGKGIRNVVNYYLPKEKDKRLIADTKADDNTIHAGSDFTGKLTNIDVSSDPSITHVNVDKHAPYQTATLDSIRKLTRTYKRPATTPREIDGR